jgi:hypothetical protein
VERVVVPWCHSVVGGAAMWCGGGVMWWCGVVCGLVWWGVVVWSV